MFVPYFRVAENAKCFKCVPLISVGVLPVKYLFQYDQHVMGLNSVFRCVVILQYWIKYFIAWFQHLLMDTQMFLLYYLHINLEVSKIKLKQATGAGYSFLKWIGRNRISCRRNLTYTTSEAARREWTNEKQSIKNMERTPDAFVQERERKGPILKSKGRRKARIGTKRRDRSMEQKGD